MEWLLPLIVQSRSHFNATELWEGSSQDDVRLPAEDDITMGARSVREQKRGREGAFCKLAIPKSRITQDSVQAQ